MTTGRINQVAKPLSTEKWSEPHSKCLHRLVHELYSFQGLNFLIHPLLFSMVFLRESVPHIQSWLLSASDFLGCPYPFCIYFTSPPSNWPPESLFKGFLSNQVAHTKYMDLISKALAYSVLRPRFSQRSLPRAELNRIPWVFFSTKIIWNNQCAITHSSSSQKSQAYGWNFKRRKDSGIGILMEYPYQPVHYHSPEL